MPRVRPLGWPAFAVTAVLLVAAGTGLGLALHGSSAQALGPISTSTCGPPSQPDSSKPQLCVNQPYGDGDTGFAIHGGGFAPFARVTVTLVGVGVAPELVTDRQGTFNYVIDQGHYFFKGTIPQGDYRVTAAGQGGPSASVTFRVYPPNNPPPLPGQGSVPGPP